MGVSRHFHGVQGARRHSQSGDSFILFRKAAVIYVVCITLTSLSGCSTIIPMMFPSRPYSSIYVVNRDGDLYVGDKCSSELVEAGVVSATEDAVFDPERAAWRVTAEPAIPEFLIYETELVGLRTLADDGTYPTAEPIWIYVVSVSGYTESTWIVLDEVLESMVFNDASPESWGDFWKMPKRDFGCR